MRSTHSYGRVQRMVASAFLDGREFITVGLIGCDRGALYDLVRLGVIRVVAGSRAPQWFTYTAKTATWIDRIMAEYQPKGHARPVPQPRAKPRLPYHLRRKITRGKQHDPHHCT